MVRLTTEMTFSTSCGLLPFNWALWRHFPLLYVDFWSNVHFCCLKLCWTEVIFFYRHLPPLPQQLLCTTQYRRYVYHTILLWYTYLVLHCLLPTHLPTTYLLHCCLLHTPIRILLICIMHYFLPCYYTCKYLAPKIMHVLEVPAWLVLGLKP